jgi:hypothetical protein
MTDIAELRRLAEAARDADDRAENGDYKNTLAESDAIWSAYQHSFSATDFLAILDRLEAAEARLKEAEHKAVGRGMIIAAQICMNAFGAEREAAEILGAAGINTVKDAKDTGVDDYDINAIRSLLEEPTP